MASTLEKMGAPKRLAKCEIATYPDERIREVVLKRVATWKPGDCLAFIGDTGRGKTGMAIAVVKELISKAVKWEKINGDTDMDAAIASILASAQFMFVNTVDLLPMLRSNIEKAEGVIDSLKKTSLLILDDLGAEKPSDFGIETLYRILNARYNELKSTIITTNLLPEDLKGLFNAANLGAGLTGDRLISRLNGWISIVKLKGSDLRSAE